MQNQFIQTLTAPVENTLTYLRNEKAATIEQPGMSVAPKQTMYLWIFGLWIASLIWFEPRLLQLLNIAISPLQYVSILLLIIFIDFAWLYGIYNLGIISFAVFYKLTNKKRLAAAAELTTCPSTALLYTTCNDFSEKSALSCLQQNYPDFKLYILDDSTEECFKKRVDDFAKCDADKILVVRRPDRINFKAGNMNYALTHVANKQKYFAIADADEILPKDFLRRLVPVMESDPQCGFVQANHRANPDAETQLQQDMAVGIDTHWKWYQPLRNQYGFVMFLGHGALLRYDCWKMINGFPNIVSEDLGFAIAVREKGYRGKFEENVTCYEDFPDSIRSFRIRHMKWTRGTCEFLNKKFWWLLKSKNISWAEKADILFPTLNLPLTLVFFVFMVNTNIIMPSLFGHTQNLTWVFAGNEMVIPVIQLNEGFGVINSPDFYAITLLTLLSPVLCFIIAMRKTPVKLFRFLSYSTALYAALSILSSIGVIAYMISGKAIFLVTGDKNQSLQKQASSKKGFAGRLKDKYSQFINKSHPDSLFVQLLEVIVGLIFLIAAIKTMQIAFFGLCFAFMLLPLLHHLGWEKRITRVISFLPFVMILFGVMFGVLSIFGMQSVFFGYGFHF